VTAHLDRGRIHSAFTALAEELRQERVRGEIVLAGGAVMVLHFDVDRVTRDVDGLITEGHGPVIEAAQRVAAKLSLPRGWLNEGVSLYLSTEHDPSRVRSFDHPHLIVYSASAEHMLALKARAARAQDLADLRLLAAELGLASSSEVAKVVERFFPDDPLSESALAVLVELFDTHAELAGLAPRGSVRAKCVGSSTVEAARDCWLGQSSFSKGVVLRDVSP